MESPVSIEVLTLVLFEIITVVVYRIPPRLSVRKVDCAEFLSVYKHKKLPDKRSGSNTNIDTVGKGQINSRPFARPSIVAT